MTTLSDYLKNIKKQDFTIIIEKDIEEIHFYYNRKDNAIVVRNICHWSASDYYRLSETDEIINLYGEFENLIK